MRRMLSMCMDSNSFTFNCDRPKSSLFSLHAFVHYYLITSEFLSYEPLEDNEMLVRFTNRAIESFSVRPKDAFPSFVINDVQNKGCRQASELTYTLIKLISLINDDVCFEDRR